MKRGKQGTPAHEAHKAKMEHKAARRAAWHKRVDDVRKAENGDMPDRMDFKAMRRWSDKQKPTPAILARL